MHCPRCDQNRFNPDQPCTTCGFSGDCDLIEELAHVRWILGEAGAWNAISATDRRWLRQKYTGRQYELEVALGLRLPRFSKAEAARAWPDLFHREALLRKVEDWLNAGLLQPVAVEAMNDRTRDQLKELREQLEGHPRPLYPQTDRERLKRVDFLLEAVRHLDERDCFVDPSSQQRAMEPLLAEKEALEIELGLRSRPEAVTKPVQAPAPAVSSEINEPAAVSVALPAAHVDRRQPSAAPAAAPPAPLLDRLWRTLVSERTLQALLFLGIFLLFSAALSFVIWGWREFSAPLRVAIPTGFTALFFGLGWYVRTKTNLHRSGLALSAIAALLIPIDFYTIYVNLNIPSAYGPSFWLVTSLICLGAYIAIALLVRSRLFGYLVGTAAGSAALAIVEIGHQLFGLSLDWRTAGLSLLALGLIVTATLLTQWQEEGSTNGDSPLGAHRLIVLAEPFRYLALFTVSSLMLLTFGWRFIEREGYDTLHYALTVNWWVGGLVFAWGGIYYRSRSLGLLAVIALPVATYLTQAAIFDALSIHPAWHAFGWALLVPLYFSMGYNLRQRTDDPVIYGHGRTVTWWGTALLLVAAFWSLTDLSRGTAAAGSHAVLALSLILAAYLWQRPGYLYGASFFSFTAATFAVSELNLLSISHLSLGWASLAILHMLAALRVGTGFPGAAKGLGTATDGKAGQVSAEQVAGPLVRAGFLIAGLALIPPLTPYNGPLLAYALGNWLGLAAWGSRLAHLGQPGFTSRSFWSKSIFHWFTSLPLAMWIWVLFTMRQPADFKLALALSCLAWGMAALSYRFSLGQALRAYHRAWYAPALLVSAAALVTAFFVAPAGFTPALSLLIIGLLYMADAYLRQRAVELLPAGLLVAWGYALLLDRLGLPVDGINLALAGLIALYIGGGLWLERGEWRLPWKRAAGPAPSGDLKFSRRFLRPLYLVGHILAVIVLWRIYIHPLSHYAVGTVWTDEMRLWGAAAQLVLAIVYGLYAWATFQERWGHAAAWLAAASGGFVAITFSHGRGSSAMHTAVAAAAFVLAERSLHWAWRLKRPQENKRQQAFFRLTWRLYKRPLLLTGWLISAAAVGLALVRNLWLLGGGRPQQTWAAAGLLLLVGLFGVSAHLFHRARFAWLAAILVLAPWTILSRLGWYTPYQPTAPGYGLSWAVLAWILVLVGLALERRVGRPYALSCKVVGLVLMPFALVWSSADPATGRFTSALGVALYGTLALLAYRKIDEVSSATPSADLPGGPWSYTQYLYPALGLFPVWCAYLLAWLIPGAGAEDYGLLFLVFGPVGLGVGYWFRRIAPTPELRTAYALPAYLTGYGAVLVGTVLVGFQGSLLSAALLYDALLFLAAAWLFRSPLWVYPAAAAMPVSLVLALKEIGVASNRFGWWLIGLASIYTGMAWILRRAGLREYGSAALAASLILIPAGLPASSLDQTGAGWGYGAAAVLYGLMAFWLSQPLLLLISAGLVVTPYAVILQQSGLAPVYYGLGLFPGALAALAAGWRLDRRFGSWSDFPWRDSARWPAAAATRLLEWWALPLYLLGFGLAVASPWFSGVRAGLTALCFLLMTPLFGWAIYYFRRRGWLLALAVAGHLAAVFLLAEWELWREPAVGWFWFLPVTLVTAASALVIQGTRKEAHPLETEHLFGGWSGILYIMLLFDITYGQLFSLSGTGYSTAITLTHIFLISMFACLWQSTTLSYLALSLGVVAIGQYWFTSDTSTLHLPVLLAWLAIVYGALGYGLAVVRDRLAEERELRPWLALWEVPSQRLSIILAGGTLVLAGLLGLGIGGRDSLATVQMFVNVLALIGLLYIAVAFVHRWARLGYVATAMLLGAWVLHAFYINQWHEGTRIQWYAIPAGLYLLGIAFMEWRRGNKRLARWLDYAAIILMLGSLFWQTLLFGWSFALLLGGEGFSAFWWGSARRLRRFFYAGMLGVVLATVGQLINSLRSINQWIVFGGIGLLLVIVAVVVERKLEDIKAWHVVLESWE